MARNRAKAATAERSVRPFAVAITLFAVSLVALLLATTAADAAFVRPLESAGEIAAVLDVHDRPAADGAFDVVLLIGIPNRELAFHESWGGGGRGTLQVEASLTLPDGAVVRRSESIDLHALESETTGSKTYYQIATVALEGVSAPYAALECVLRDETASRVVSRDEAPRLREGVFRGEWVAPPTPTETPGLYLHGPLFLSGAPTGLLPAELGGAPALRRSAIAEHLHPPRRYGLEQDLLQVAFDVEAAGRDGGAAATLPRHLLVQVLAKELDLAYRDTIDVMDDPGVFLASGGRGTLVWELDVSDLPPGSYQLSCAPLDGLGGAWVHEFDVIWSMDALARARPDQELMGYLVLPDDLLDRFEVVGPVERDAILARFWEEHDPDPSTRLNEAEIEFRQRMTYVRHYLGGFGRRTVMDDRATIFLLLGPPDDVEKVVIPINSESFETAMEKVYNSFVPIRQGLLDKPVPGMAQAAATTVQADRERTARMYSNEKLKAYELWLYRANGRTLFPHRYEALPMGSRFLFLARLSESTYKLESTNVTDFGTAGD